MEILSVKNLTFRYDNSENPILNNISFTVNKGEFVVVCGKSGCGKTTLLRLIKRSLSPSGRLEGDIFLEVSDLKIGYVFQNPESQLIMDNVFDELIFGCENIGMNTSLIKLKLGELCAYLGIEDLLSKKCTALSGGEKQLINLAGVLMMEPEIIILDEPFSMLDPIASDTFLSILTRLHRELGITVILCEHTLDNVLIEASKILYFTDNAAVNNLLTFYNSDDFIEYISNENPSYKYGLPPLARLGAYGAKKEIVKFKHYPLTVAEWKHLILNTKKEELTDFLHTFLPRENHILSSNEAVINLKNVCFRYEKNSNDIINHLSLSIQKGSLYAIIGGNGAGKTTLLSLLTGYRKPYSGKIKVLGTVGYLPQNPAYAFTDDNVLEDLKLICKNNHISYDIIDKTINLYPVFEELKDYLNFNPLDLSGGQMQLMALLKILLLSPDVLILDEPTKGLDGFHKDKLSKLFSLLRQNGTTIVMVSHDLNFVSENADRCGMMFMGTLSVSGSCNQVLSSNHFYTTALYRILKGLN